VEKKKCFPNKTTSSIFILFFINLQKTIIQELEEKKIPNIKQKSINDAKNILNFSKALYIYNSEHSKKKKKKHT